MIKTENGNYKLKTDEERDVFEKARDKIGSSREFLIKLGYPENKKSKFYGATYQNIRHGTATLSLEKWIKVKDIYKM